MKLVNGVLLVGQCAGNVCRNMVNPKSSVRYLHETGFRFESVHYNRSTAIQTWSPLQVSYSKE